MIPLILRTCLRVSTPTTASASAGPDAYPLVFTVNMLYLHAPPSPTPAFCVCVPPVSLSSAFLSLSLFCASSRGNFRCLLLDVHCLRDSFHAITVSKGPRTRDRRYRISGSETAQ
jgi:hypothetical protein